MGAFPKSSWFLLLLGFSLLAATLQEPDGDCPSPEKVSCTTGVKCNSDEDCDKNNICCANSCYTKRCIPNTNGVQGGAEGDGPTEKECRPYIEKALKELTETGEAKPESSETDSVEDLPTVEITTDDSTEQAGNENDTEDEDGARSDETDNASEHSVDEADTGTKSDEQTAQTDEDKDESLEETKQASKEESKEQSKEDEAGDSQEEDKPQSAESAEKPDESPEEQTLEAKEASAESVEVRIEAPTLAAVPIVPIQDESDETKSEEQAESKEDDGVEDQQERSAEQDDGDSKEGASVEKQGKAGGSKEDEASKEEKDESNEQSDEKVAGDSVEDTGCPSKDKVSCSDGVKCNSDKDCRKNHVCCPNKCYTSRCVRSPGVESAEDDEESAEAESAAKSDEKEDQSAESGEVTGCPKPDKVSCTGGTLCNSHANCQDNEICCLNKCYRKRCVEGELAEGEERGEPSAEEPQIEEKQKSAEAPATPEASSGCPPKHQVSCSGGIKCNKHLHCKDNEICCPNNCYGRRCVEGEIGSGEDRGSESEEDKSEEKTQQAKSSESGEKTGCPSSGDVSCQAGPLCGKHADCDDNEICCPNKCYRRSCIEGELASGEERGAKSDEDESHEKSEKDKSAESGEKTGCPSANEVSCQAGPLCGKHADCDDNEICCPNKCYRRSCIEGELAEGEERGDKSSEEEPPKTGKDDSKESGEKTGCPAPSSLPCGGGSVCSKHKECGSSEICCPNKCYRKQCVEGELAPGEGDEESDEEEEEPPKPAPKPRVTPVAPVSAPPPKKIETKIVKEEVKVQKKPVPKVIREVKIVEQKPSEDSTEKEDSHVEDLTADEEAPTELRSRDHVEQLLKLDDESTEKENIINRVADITLKELKRLYEHAIKPLEVLYKYRDLSNRHFGDPEIFSKPLVLFMGPWSGGKSSIINYLTNNEYNETSLRTGAEPSPAYFNILMHGDEPEIIDGTQLAADFTFSGLQKFGQGLEERLRGVKLPMKLLEKVNIVEIPGILEVRKQVSRLFPFNDACQWFIDRADIIFLVYDPSKLDVGPETEAILDQLKGREHQTRIILNKADQVKPEELMRVQGALIWNISPLMSSPQPPVMYTTSLWSKPYESWAPTRLLQAQERAFLRDLRSAVDKRIENKIASARRFAVRVRNHAKMVDCYLTTYYNHKSVFGNRKQVADEIIERPQDYHIYEGLSTLTNISRYDLPDPDVYKDFFKLNPLYDFQQLSATCTYFRGCPINRLDVAIAYDLPELVGNHKKLVEEAIANKDKPKEEKSKSKSKQKSAPGS